MSEKKSQNLEGTLDQNPKLHHENLEYVPDEEIIDRFDMNKKEEKKKCKCPALNHSLVFVYKINESVFLVLVRFQMKE